MDFGSAFKFLKALSKNNNREWFESKKPLYLTIKKEFDDFVVALHGALSVADESLAPMNPKKAVFRIYRDIRFSKDKIPYKTHLSAGFSPHGKMEQEPGYYLHIEGGNKSRLSGGMWMPESDHLMAIRQEIDYNSERFLKIINDRKFKKTFGALADYGKLKTTPKGYVSDHPQIDLLRHKSFVVSHVFSDKEVLDKKFIKNVAMTVKTLKPLVDFLSEAIA